MSDVVLPKQVQQSVEELEEYERSLSASGEPEEASQQDEPVEQAAVEPSEPSEYAKLEQRHRTLQGKYDAEVPRLHSELRDLREQLAQRQVQPPPEPPKAPEPPPSLVTKEDYENFGEETIDLNTRVARQVAQELEKRFQAKFSELEKENAALRAQVGQVHGDSFQARLLQAVPDFLTIDQDPRWVEWLNEFEPMIQAPRRTLAQAAYDNRNVDALKAYVSMFKATLNGNPKQARNEELRKQVQPAKASAPRQAPTAQGKIYTDKEVRAAFDRIPQMLARGQDKEAAALEQEISAAYVEGRVRV